MPNRMTATPAFRSRTDCRLCGSRNLEEILSFGETPLANAYLAEHQLTAPEVFAPLVVNFCNDCTLVQLRDVVDPHVLFDHYLYVSGTSPAFVAHFAEYARRITSRFLRSAASLVVDVGSNDGVLLAAFKKSGARILGVDPANNIAAGATKRGIPTVPRFFDIDAAVAIRREHGPADVITANNVFAHTDDVASFVDAVKALLAPKGVFVFEVQYLKDLVEKNLFDIIYHEHLCYYHLNPLIPFFRQAGLRVFDVEHVGTHGGSVRVYVAREDVHPISEGLSVMLEREEALNDIRTYREFRKRIDTNGRTLAALLGDIRRRGQRVVGYGAPAKATTLCYAFGIDATTLEYVVDDSPLKQGLFMPGTHIPVKSPEALYADYPDCCLILAWNFADSIVENHARFAQSGGVFILPVPEPRRLP
jgi:SAM-dependent methyltransferase